MRVLHAVTLISNDSRFGGPTQVALGICSSVSTEFTAELIGLSQGIPLRNRRYQNAQVILFKSHTIIRRLGFSGIYNLRIFVWLLINLRKFDLIHIHMTRDMVTFPIAVLCYLFGKDYVLQPHGMIDLTTKKLGQLIDFCFTRRIMRNARFILSLTEEEDRDLLAVEPKISLERFLNSVDIPQLLAQKEGVIFVGRLSHDKRPDLFIEMAEIVLKERGNVSFTIIGPDGGLRDKCLDYLVRKGLTTKISLLGPMSHEEILSSIGNAQILVLPSPRDRFPLVVIEALAAGTSVVVSAGNGLAHDVKLFKSGIVCELNPRDLANSVIQILDDFLFFSENARSQAEQNYGRRQNIDNLSRIYKSIKMS